MVERRSGQRGTTDLQSIEFDLSGIPAVGIPRGRAVVPAVEAQVLLGRAKAGLHQSVQEPRTSAKRSRTLRLQPSNQSYLERERPIQAVGD